MIQVCRNITMWLSVCCLIFLAINTAALAAEKSTSEERRAKMLERFPEADTDKDGVLSTEELTQFVRSRRGNKQGADRMGGHDTFNPMSTADILKNHPDADTNGDGKLSKDERKAFVEKQHAEKERELLTAYPELDTDGNGTLSKEERRAGADKIRVFMQTKMAERVLAEHPEADTNGDGRLSPEEFRAFQKKQGDQSKNNPSPAQFISWLMKNFNKVDKDANGQLSKEELQAYQKELLKDNKDMKDRKDSKKGKDRSKRKKDKQKANE